MHIVLLADRIPPYDPGGAGKIVWRLASGFQSQGHRVSIITATPDSDHNEVQEDISIYYLHSHYLDRFRAWLSLYNPQTVGKVRRLLKELAPDIVNAHNVHTDLSYATISIAHRMGFPVVFFSHDLMPIAYGKVDHFVDPKGREETEPNYHIPLGYDLRLMRFRYNPLRNPVIRFILNHHTQSRIAISHVHKTALEANGLSPFQVVYHGFDVEGYQRPAEAVMEKMRQELNLEGRRVIFFGGRLTEGKGSRVLLAALNEIVPQMPEVLLLTLSTTPFDRSLLQEFPNLRDDHVRDGGWRLGDELLAAFHLADVIAVPPIYLDPCPSIIYEAMAVSKPLVVSSFGGAKEVILEGETGYIVNPFDTTLFAARLSELLRNSALRESFGLAAQQHLASHYSFKKQLSEILAIYAETISPG
jgi:glycosyltransferase involved in cell wall biosynthesis